MYSPKNSKKSIYEDISNHKLEKSEQHRGFQREESPKWLSSPLSPARKSGKLTTIFDQDDNNISQLETESKIHLQKMQSEGMRIVRQLKQSVSTNSTLKEPSVRSKSSRQLLYQFRGLKKQDFVLGYLLGKGKFGSVYVAKHKKTGFICALKVINKAKIVQQNLLHQLIREIKIQSYCDHPNLTKLYGFFSTTEEICLITQLSSEGQLYKLIKKSAQTREKLSQKLISSLLKQVCQGVRYLHTLKIIHRDLKPQNIVLERGVVKICDFGWAVWAKVDLRSTFCGTPLYVSPQVLKGQSYDQKIDLWALGIMAYEMMYGQIPFQINHEIQLVKIIKDDIVFPSLPKASDQFKDFVQNILRKNPKQRFKLSVLLDHPFLQQS